jgi:ABC-2 type transport system permease protein
MSTQSNAIPESAVGSQVSRAAEFSPARRMYWSVKRELWENRSIYIAPLAVAGIFLLGFFISTLHLPARMRNTPGIAPLERGLTFARTYDFAALVLMGTTLLVAVFYCLDALYGERRDRSILFWKSLPVSDATTVMSKASIPLIILPVVTFFITVALHCAMLLVSGAVLLAGGQSLAVLAHLSLGMRWTMLLYHLVVGHGLYYAPFFGWFLLVSAWARRATFLWAVLPPLVVGVLEKILFSTSHFASLIGNQFGMNTHADNSRAMSAVAMIADAPALSSPGLWIGMLVTVLFLVAAVQLRRRQGPV